MIKAFVDAAQRFEDKMNPLGYEAKNINWVININPKSLKYSINQEKFKKDTLQKIVPTRGDRSGNASQDNLKAALLVDNAIYALGIPEEGKKESAILVHKGFIQLLDRAYEKTSDADLKIIPEFLKSKKDKKLFQSIAPKDIIAFKTNTEIFPFEKECVKNFWIDYLMEEYSESKAYCSVCGLYRPILRIFPWKIHLFRERCPISSINKESFESFGQKQNANSPLCFECAGKASQVLQYLTNSEKHRSIIAKDESKGEGKSPLKNQLAIFWLKEETKIQTTDGITIDFEELLKAPILDINQGKNIPAPDPAQLKRLLNIPWAGQLDAFNISRNHFYLAVLTPNKSRLVVREWIDESLDSVLNKIQKFVKALIIVHPDGRDPWPPTIPDIISALKPEASKSASADANLVRELIRTAYKGTSPPENLLVMALQRFRIPDRTIDKKEEKDKQTYRRMSLVAAMKLVLTYNRKEAKTMESLDEKETKRSYLCGRLLAILEEIQLRQAHWNLNTTLVDRFYGSASTAPSSVFGNLIKMATTAHLPKLHKQGYGEEIKCHLIEVQEHIYNACGFPDTLSTKEQAEFALGFYHQRAIYRKIRRPQTITIPTQTNTDSTQEEKND